MLREPHEGAYSYLFFFLYNNCREHPPLRVRRSSLRVPSRTVRVIYYIYIYFFFLITRVQERTHLLSATGFTFVSYNR